jgi:hypothetical protein
VSDVEVLADLLDVEVVGEQLGAVAGVDAVEARPPHRRRGDAQVDLGGTRLPQHADQLVLGGAPHDRVVHHHQPLAWMFSRSGLSFRRTAWARASWLGAMKLRPM